MTSCVSRSVSECDHDQVVDIRSGRACDDVIFQCGECGRAAVGEEVRSDVHPGGPRSARRQAVGDRAGVCACRRRVHRYRSRAGPTWSLASNSSAALSTSSWFGPPDPKSASPESNVTVDSPPHPTTTERAGKGLAVPVWTSWPCLRPTLPRERASVARLSPNTIGSRPRAHDRSRPSCSQIWCPSTITSVWISTPSSDGEVAEDGHQVALDVVIGRVPEMIGPHHLDRLLAGGRIRNRRVCDEILRATGDVADREVDDGCGGCGQRQPPGLDRRHVLAHRVDFADSGSTRQQAFVELSLRFKTDRRRMACEMSAELPPVIHANTRSRLPALSANASRRSAE